ncbi:MAG: hypothetical protein AAF909_00200 [Pseudomonadota bacterium]
MAGYTRIRRGFAFEGRALLFACAVAAGAVTPVDAHGREPASVCAEPSDRGYADGLAGAPAVADFSRCPASRAAYQTAYGAGLYVAGEPRVAQAARARAGASSAAPRTRDVRLGASGPGGPRGRVRPTTQETLARARLGAALASGRAGGPAPRLSGAPAPLRRQALQDYQRGQAARAAQRSVAASLTERLAIRSRLLKPTATAADRRLAQNRLRQLDRQDALRRFADPVIRPIPRLPHLR